MAKGTEAMGSDIMNGIGHANSWWRNPGWWILFVLMLTSKAETWIVRQELREQLVALESQNRRQDERLDVLGRCGIQRDNCR